MIFAVVFEDDPAKADMRPKFMSQHLDFLASNGARIQAAGPLLEADGRGAGGLWLVDAASADEAMALVKQDPFWPTGLRKSVRILQWKQVFAAGKKLL